MFSFILGEKRIRARKSRRLINVAALFLVLTFVATMLLGCSFSQKESDELLDGEIYLYYVGRDDASIGTVKYRPENSSDIGLLTDEVIAQLSSNPDDTTLQAILGVKAMLSGYELISSQLVMNFDASYFELEKGIEVLFRASLVKTMCQLDGIESVVFSVESQPLSDMSGKPYGSMMADSFIDNTGSEMDAYDRTELTLYFANKKGDALVADKIIAAYPTNTSMERLVLEKLLAGPKNPDLRATLSEERKINSVVVKDGTCYVNLSEASVDLTGAVDEQVSLYSIVNSLTELTSINKVQISIDGDIGRTFRGGMPLGTSYERNLDIIEER